MASLTLTASLMGGAATVSGQKSRSLVVKASASKEGEKSVNLAASSGAEGNNSRRAIMFAAAAAAISAVGGTGAIALADEPKRGTPEAKKAYAPICVTMPTAKICHK